jgi:hypothetical protein
MDKIIGCRSPVHPCPRHALVARLRRYFYKNTIRTRSNQRVFVYTLFASAVSLLLVPHTMLFHFTLFALPLAVFIGYYFLSFKTRPWIGELFLWGWCFWLSGISFNFPSSAQLFRAFLRDQTPAGYKK